LMDANVGTLWDANVGMLRSGYVGTLRDANVVTSNFRTSLKTKGETHNENSNINDCKNKRI